MRINSHSDNVSPNWKAFMIIHPIILGHLLGGKVRESRKKNPQEQDSHNVAAVNQTGG
jgi:hypothetical protein